MEESELKKLFFEKLEEKIEESKFNTWIKPLELKIQDDSFVILAKSKFAKNWLEKEYIYYFTDSLDEINPGKNYNIKIDFNLKNSNLNKTNLSNQKNNEKSKKSAEKKKHKSINIKDTGLLNDYTFDKFVKGDSNSMAFDAAKAIVEKPGKTYNPLYIYGETALGKTHLMNAVGHEILKRNPDASVYFLSSENFAQEMAKSIQQNKMDEFKEKYRNLDVLLIDDIQFFLGKNKSMDEFFYTFNTLLERENQIVLTSDVHPNGSNLESRIKSRLSKGLSVPITPPNFETRKEILLKKAQNQNKYLPDEVATYIAKRIKSHVRDLEGALNKVVASSNFKGEEITIELVNKELKDLFDIQKTQIGIDNIQKIVADYFKISLVELLSKKRSNSIARPRQIAMSLARELTTYSLPEIGKSFGGRDHSTVINAVKRVKKLIETDKNFKEDWEILNRKLRN